MASGSTSPIRLLYCASSHFGWMCNQGMANIADAASDENVPRILPSNRAGPNAPSLMCCTRYAGRFDEAHCASCCAPLSSYVSFPVYFMAARNDFHDCILRTTCICTIYCMRQFADWQKVCVTSSHTLSVGRNLARAE